jgi:5'(3')-deoxyribonucleotidase
MVMNGEFLVFFDMDGVLADFDEAYDRLIGKRKPNGDVFWPEVDKFPNFFRDLNLVQEAIKTWELVPPERRRILSSIPKSIDEASNQKRDWLRRWMDIPDEHIYLVRGRRLKKAFARPSRVLIDNWPQNVTDWEDAGGIGILHKTHHDTFIQLTAVMLGIAGRVAADNYRVGQGA